MELTAALQKLVREGTVSQEVARTYARDPEQFGRRY